MKRVLLTVGLWMMGVAGIAVAGGPALTEGKAAPPLTVSQWLRGKPVEKFEPGKIYVVEFWATWCKPCVAASPHLTELQKRYAGDGVTVVAVAGFESGDKSADKIAAVERFVAEHASELGYTIGVDATEATNRDWMEAADVATIPASFVVDRQGRVAYIGSPDNLGGPLAKIVAGTWDIEAHRAAKGTVVSFRSSYKEATDAGDWKNALEIADAALAQVEGKDPFWVIQKLIALGKLPEKRAALIAYSNEVVKQPGQSPYILALVLSFFYSAEVAPAEDVRALGKTIVTDLEPMLMAMEKQNSGFPVGVFFSPIAHFYVAEGEIEKAIVAQERVVKVIQGPNRQQEVDFLASLKERAKKSEPEKPAGEKESAAPGEAPAGVVCEGGVCRLVPAPSAGKVENGSAQCGETLEEPPASAS